ncbi:CatB-related O-acetyltransferase [Cognataquiflexum aquatile]|uniref:CatB-related O-acetyltransferase n=1 Tax=Cognataquiflexum aquatile TaxID=2249427 RepID=UPI000DE9F36F|nr:CatB-related O-acetyltransferase [Cognataquiflexum aquatile]
MRGPLRFLINYLRNLLSEHDTLIDKRVTIGEHTYGVSPSTVLLFRNDDQVEIGKFCSFAKGVQLITSGEHNYHLVSSFPFYSKILNLGDENDTLTKGKITVGHDVWIGANAIILSGVTIGHGAVIAAGAVVANDVLPYSIVGGVPAKLIKFRFSESTIKEIIDIGWWDWSNSYLIENIDDMYMNLPDFLRKHKKEL